MASEVSIANLALSRQGQRANISSLNPPEGSSFAETMALFLPLVRDRLLQEHNWSWATKRSTLASTTVPATMTAWEYAFALPSDYLKAQRLLPEEATNDDQGVAYKIESGVLYTNEPSPTLVYTFRQTDPTKWSPAFCNAAADWLAADTIGTIVRGADARTKLALIEAAKQSLSLAKDSDSVSTQGSGSGQLNTPYARYTPSSIKARGTSYQIPDARIIRS